MRRTVEINLAIQITWKEGGFLVVGTQIFRYTA
ncbi:hypothetical protein A2U01_0082815, partial [Trifolium medium]|nr:hypothetical protein [Trifolium medium]